MDQSKLKSNESVKVTSSAPFHRPLQAVYTGGPNREEVKVTHLGDADGMSPVYFVIDSTGRGLWVSQSDVQILDDEITVSQGSASQASRQASTAGR